MNIVIFSSLLALILTLLDSRGSVKEGMKWGFFIITFLGCIHYNYGNDYIEYHRIYNSIVSTAFDWEYLISGDIYKEPGWAILCYVFKPIGGFFMMVAVLNIIQNAIVYKVIIKNVSRAWWPLSVFVYLFSTSFYLLNFSMMRQGLAICLFLGAWEAIRNRKFFVTLLMLLIASTIHTSALILIPVALTCFVNINKGRIAIVLFLLIYILIWFKGGFINDVLLLFLNVEDFSEYALAYGDEVSTNSYSIGFILNLIPLLLSLIYIGNTSGRYQPWEKLAVAISIVCFIIVPFTEVVPLIGRIGMYFGIYQIIAIPKIYSNIKKSIVRIILLFIYSAIMIYNYLSFFSSPTFHDAYSTFHTIFSAL